MRLDLLKIHEVFYRQRCNVNMTVVGLRYEQFCGLVILLMTIDKWSLECQRCSVNLTIIDLLIVLT